MAELENHYVGDDELLGEEDRECPILELTINKQVTNNLNSYM